MAMKKVNRNITTQNTSHGMALAWIALRLIESNLSSGISAKRSIRFLSPVITSTNAHFFSIAVPCTCEGSGKPQCAVAG